MTRILVIHVNSFTRQIDGGYRGHMHEGKIIQEQALSRAQVIQQLVDEPATRVEFCKV